MCVLQSEFFLEASSLNDVSIFLDYNSILMRPVYLEMDKGIPFIKARTLDENSSAPVYVMGVKGIAPEEGSRPFPESAEASVLEYLKGNCAEVESKLSVEICQREENELMNYGKDIRSSLANAICFDVMLDERTVSPAYLYCASRFLSPEALEDIRREVLRRTETFLGEQMEKGFLTKEAFRSQLAFNKKAISDKFHPWTILKGKLNHRLGNIGCLLEGIEPKDICLVASWAVSDPAYAPYLSQLDDWITSKAKCFRFSRKLIDDLLSKSGCLQNLRNGVEASRPKLPDDIIMKAKRSFGHPSM